MHSLKLLGCQLGLSIIEQDTTFVKSKQTGKSPVAMFCITNANDNLPAISFAISLCTCHVQNVDHDSDSDMGYSGNNLFPEVTISKQNKGHVDIEDRKLLYKLNKLPDLDDL